MSRKFNLLVLKILTIFNFQKQVAMIDKLGKTKVILVEDDAEDIEFFMECLEDLPYEAEVTTYRNGQEFVDGMIANRTNLPDLVFLDLNMPVKNGVQALKELRALPDFKNIPVVAIYSTSISEKDHAETFLHGADAFISKPNDYKDLKRLIRQIFEIDWKNRNTDKKNFIITPL